MKTTKTVLVVSLLLACVAAGKAQNVFIGVTAPNPSCAIAIYDFERQGNSVGITQIEWDFGDGTPHVLGQDKDKVTHPYSTPGTYTVTLTVTYNGTTVRTDWCQVVVHDVPHFTFSADKDTICPGETVNFTVNFIPPTTSADIASYMWQFGDGGTDTAMNPSYTYLNGQNLDWDVNNVSLRLITKNGCEDRVDVNSMVVVRRKPDVNFTTDKGANVLICFSYPNQTDTVEFYNLTDVTPTGGFPPPYYAYKWYFGDGDSSSLIKPSHSYSPGVFNVTLTATDTYGCLGSLTKNAMIQGVNYKVHTIPSDTVVLCGTPAPFMITGSDGGPAITYYIDFGNGYELYCSVCATTYENEGIYSVIVSGTHPSGCISRDTVMVYVYDSVPALHTITDTMMCNPADSIRFEDNTAYNNAIFKDFGKGKVEWFFGDTASPASGYAVGSDVRYAYGGFGKFVCKQVVTTPYGCILDTVEQPIRIFPISAFGTVFNPAPPLPPEGCVPFKIDVMSVFDSLKTSSPIVDYIWKWDYAKTATDTTHSGSQEFETHTYTDTGTFEVYATLINQQGCTADIYVETVRVGVEPAAYFTYQFIQGCRNEIGLQVQAYDSLQGGGLLGAAGANGWEWYDVENPFFPIATGQTASLAFSEKIGYQGLVLIPKHNGCAGASIFADSVAYLCPPIAKINYPQNYPDGTPPVFCEYPLIYFENGSVGWTKSEWYMGDTLNGIPAFAGQTKFEQYALYDGITGNPLPNYPDPDPSFDYAPLNPLTQDTNFYLYKNQGMVLITLKAYNGDSLSNEFLPDGTTLHPTYNRCKYCEDTATQIVLISNALMNFVADRNEVCQGNSVEFIDSTFCLITLTGWGIKVLSAENPSTAEYPVGQFIEMNLKPQVGQGFLLPFEVPNVYEFVLYDTCAFGCVRNDTLQVTAWTRSIPAFTTSKTPNNPSSFNTSPDTLCLNNPDTLYFKDSSTTAYPFNYLNIVQWVWEFSNIGIDSLFGYEVSAVPVNYGFSDVKLTITNEKGCDSSIVMQNRFRTDYVEARFSTYAKTYCNNVNINFTNQSTVFPQIQHESPWGNTSITCEWDWGDGTPRERQNIICGTRPNLSHTYYLPDKETVVYITLKVWMTNNPSCESIFVDSITIIRPIADFTDDGHIFPCPGPTGKEITFTSTSDGRISTYTWNFGDKWCDPNDNLAVGPSPEFKVVTHTYKKAGYYDVTLMVEDSAQGCVDIMYKPRYVFIDGPAGTFEYTPTSGCVDFRVDFQAYIDDDQYGYPTADSIGWIFDGISIFWRKGAAVALPYAYAYQTPGAYIPMLQLVKTVDNNGTMERCVVIEVGEDTIWAIDLMPDFIADSLYGLEVPVEFENTTTVMPPVLSADSVYWDYGNNDSQWIYNPAKNAANGYTMYDSEGIYTVALTAYYKLCNQSKTYVIGVKEGVGISNYELGINNYIIYPNPTTGKITVESCKVYKVESVELFDVVGKQYSVGAKHVLPNDEMVIDISHLANGMYFIKIQTDNGTVMKKVVKE